MTNPTATYKVAKMPNRYDGWDEEIGQRFYAVVKWSDGKKDRVPGERRTREAAAEWAEKFVAGKLENFKNR